jgi:hypothetical protein
LDVEELMFTYTSKSSSISRSYQLGTINFEYVHANDVILASVQNCVDSFSELIISRLGPKTGQNSREHYQLDMAKDIVKLTVDITTSEGTVIRMIKFLSRFDNSATDNIHFDLAPRTNGWRQHEYWPSTVVSGTEIRLVKAVKIKSLNSVTGENTHVIDELWDSEDGSDEQVEWHTIARCFSGKSQENDEFVEFIIKVSFEGLTWFVARRYNEFDALRHFLITQNPHNSEFQQVHSRFPGKALVFRKSVLDARLRGLEEFLGFYLTSARYCRQNALDALCFFLQIPENTYSRAKGSVQTNSRGISTILPSQASSASSPLALATLSSVSHSDVMPSEKEMRNTVPFVEKLPTISPSSKPDTAPATKKTISVSSEVHASPATSQTSVKQNSDSVGATKPAAAIASSVAQTHSSVSAPFTTHTAGVMGDNQDMNDTLSAAQRNLLEVLGEGMHIIKHGRQGAPKQRLLRCNRQATELFIQADDHRKTLKLSEVETIRLGTEVDPITSPEALKSVNDASSDVGKRPKVIRRASLSFRGINDSTVYYGTAILRRTCKSDDMKLCLSLIMPERTFDIQCKSLEDLETLHNVLQEVCGQGK